MTVEQLRLKHPRLVYKRYTVTKTPTAIVVEHEFLLEPDIVVRPHTTIPYSGTFDAQAFAPYAYRLGIIEAISYWKAACPREFVIEAGSLTNDEIRFWYDLFIHGLGEFYYRNDIDFTRPDFLRIIATGDAIPERSVASSMNVVSSKDLVLVGGGKDTAVTLGMLKKSDRSIQTMIVNPTEAAQKAVTLSGYTDPIIVQRKMDPRLGALNNEGYLNGHTPFSAYLAFLGISVAFLYGSTSVIVSNERSANEGNVMYKGLEVNHQYSKSFRFESLFREYVAEVFVDAANYFSVLRPLNDVQIGLLFAGMPEYFESFRSCNAGSKKGIWCGKCPKCAFTCLILSPFISVAEREHIFGSDYFHDPVIINYLRELVGITPVKPFECVGTRDEAKLALLLAVGRYQRESREIPEGLLKIKSDLGLTDEDAVFLDEKILSQWGDTFNLPPEHLALLRLTWDTQLVNYRATT